MAAAARAAEPLAERRRWSTSLRARLAAKRAVDVVLGTTLLLVAAPLCLVIAVAIVVLDGRPVLYRQDRAGRFGTTFTMVKFRTMVPDADRWDAARLPTNERGGPLFKVSDDPRVTRSGRLLRLTSLDELPQLLNVVRGSMSLVGPRPALLHERACFPAELLAREHVRPGLTGPWQLDGRLRADFDSYRSLDLEYVWRWTFRHDLVLLARTPGVVVRHALRRAVIDPSPVDTTSLPILDGETAA